MNEEKKKLEEEHQADSAAWNELLEETVQKLQTEMKNGISESMKRVKQLEHALEIEKKKKS